MLKLLTVIGARPQFIKAAAISREIRINWSSKIHEIMLHTGQHYDHNMSQVFFEEMQIPKPDYNLQVGSDSHGRQTASMIQGIEEVLIKEKPNCVILFGDTNSTLAGAIAASKIHIPVVHIEAGLRSFNKSMPEEINRICCDHVSTLLFTPTKAGLNNLLHEGFNLENTPPYSINNPKIFHCGDIMYDNTLYFEKIAERKKDFLVKHGLTEGNYMLCTIHRDINTDVESRLSAILRALLTISNSHHLDIAIPLHPRTAKMLNSLADKKLVKEIQNSKNIKILSPASFIDMTVLEKYSKLLMTDSGGVQKEAYFLKKPCIILRPETEWVELVQLGTAVLADADEHKIVKAFLHFNSKNDIEFPDVYGDGHAAAFMVDKIYNFFNA